MSKQTVSGQKETAVTQKKEYIVDFISGQLVEPTPEEVEAVQVFSRRLVEEFEYDKQQIRTRPQFRIRSSPSGRPKYPVDIAIFTDDKRIHGNLFMIVECKRKTRRDGEKQLKLYMGLSSAQIGVWFNGNEHLYLQKILDQHGKVTYKVLYTIPKKGERIEDIGRYKRKHLKKPTNVIALFKDIKNHVYGNVVGITRDEALTQEIMNLLFCKIYDEINTSPDDDVTFRVGMNEDPKDVKKRISNLFKDVKTQYSDIFEERDEIRLDPDSLCYVVGELQSYCLLEADSYAIGNAFEVFIGTALKGAEGQFFTPRNVVKMAVEMLDPKPNEHVIDPACGSGGFLIFALEHVWKKLEIKAKKKIWSLEILQRQKTEAANRFFVGIDKDRFLAKVSKAYMALVGDGRGGIFCENSLEFPDNWQPSTRQRVELDKSDVLFTNPPFGSKINIKKSLYSQFDFGFMWSKNRKTRKWKKESKLADRRPPQVLFIERCLQLLAPNGRMAIVLPDGLLSNPKDGYITQYIRENAVILGVVDLPMSTFLPNTPTKTHVLFLQKKKPTGNYPIFMAYAKTCGHDKRGRAIFKTDEKGRKVIDDDISEISYHFSLKEKLSKTQYNRKGFLVFIDDLKSDILLPKYYNPELEERLEEYRQTGKYDIYSIGDLVEEGKIRIRRGNEVGSVNYGSGDIPFIRTSEIANWEIIADPTHCLAEDIYEQYKNRQDLEKDDILVINDGTYLMGRCAILSVHDTRIVVQSHFRIITVFDRAFIHPYLLLFLFGLRIVQEQIESKSFRQATISTLGNRLLEVKIPIPKEKEVKENIIKEVAEIVEKRAKLRHRAMNAKFNGRVQSVIGIKNKAILGNL